MVNDDGDQILEEFAEWYSEREFDLKKVGSEDLIDKFTEFIYDDSISFNYYQVTHYQYHESIKFMMDEYDMTFNQLNPKNFLNYYMNYMSVCDDTFSKQLDEIIYGDNCACDDDDDTDDDSSDSD